MSRENIKQTIRDVIQASSVERRKDEILYRHTLKKLERTEEQFLLDEMDRLFGPER